jgi:hypothetical protein
MKKVLCFLLVLAIAGCRKDKDNSNLQLHQIQTDGQVASSFEYNDGKLVKHNSHISFCTNPVDEWTYIYQNGRLSKVETIMRGIYSSLSALCDPQSGIRTEDIYEYDGQGRLSKVTYSATYVTYHYNAQDRIIKRVSYFPSGTPHDSSTFIYDARGNITQETNSHGNSAYYEYDNKTNPLYSIKWNPGLISPYSISPNNVIRTTGINGTFERKILSYIGNLPMRIDENGTVFTYVYQ